MFQYNLIFFNKTIPAVHMLTLILQVSIQYTGYFTSIFFHESMTKIKSLVFYTPTPRRGRGVYCFTSVRPSVRPRYFSSHFSQ